MGYCPESASAVFKFTDFPEFCASSGTAWMNPTNARSTLRLWNQRDTCFALHMLTSSTWGILPAGHKISSCINDPFCWTATVLFLQLMSGSSMTSQGIPRINSLWRDGNTLAEMRRTYSPQVNRKSTQPPAQIIDLSGSMNFCLMPSSTTFNEEKRPPARTWNCLWI